METKENVRSPVNCAGRAELVADYDFAKSGQA
jgi:hypothetical protein